LLIILYVKKKINKISIKHLYRYYFKFRYLGAFLVQNIIIFQGEPASTVQMIEKA